MDGVAFHDPMHEATKKPLTTVAACHCSPYSPGRQSRPHLFHVVRKVCTKSGHVSTIPSAVKNNSHHGISTIKSDYPEKQKPEKTKPRLPWKPGFCNCEPDDVLLSLEIQPTIIGDKAFHCPVRNGKEWYRLSMVIRQWLLSAFANDFDDFIIKPSVCRRHKSQSYKTMLGVSFWLH